MGWTNLKSGLERKLAALAGQLTICEKEIAYIREQASTLPEREAEAVELRELIGHASALIKHLDPEWSESDTAPVIPFIHKLPMKLGSCSRTALEVLREASEPMTTREVAKAVLCRSGVFDPELEVLQRTTVAVDSAFRARKGKTLESDNQWPQRWGVVRAP